MNNLKLYDWDVEKDFVVYWADKPIYNFCRPSLDMGRAMKLEEEYEKSRKSKNGR